METIPEEQLKDAQSELKEIESKLSSTNETDKIIKLLIWLKKKNFSREEIVKSKIILTIKKIKEQHKDNKDIETIVLCLIKDWKNKEEKQKEEHSSTYEVIQLREDTFNSSDIDKVCNDLLKGEIDSTRKTTKRVLFTTIAESKESYRLYQASLNKSKAAQSQLSYLNKVKQTISHIEYGLYKAYLLTRKESKYKAQTKTLIARLDKNTELIESILTGKIELEALATMTSEQLLSSSEKKQLDEAKESCFEARRSDWNMVHNNVISTGMYKCGKCKGSKTTYFQIQIRRADEPMTTFVTCADCGNSWRC